MVPFESSPNAMSQVGVQLVCVCMCGVGNIIPPRSRTSIVVVSGLGYQVPKPK